jgi:hypothetical protein
MRNKLLLKFRSFYSNLFIIYKQYRGYFFSRTIYIYGLPRDSIYFKKIRDLSNIGIPYLEFCYYKSLSYNGYYKNRNPIENGS